MRAEALAPTTAAPSAASPGKTGALVILTCLAVDLST